MSLRNCSCVVAVIVVALIVFDGTRLRSQAIVSTLRYVVGVIKLLCLNYRERILC